MTKGKDREDEGRRWNEIKTWKEGREKEEERKEGREEERKKTAEEWRMSCRRKDVRRTDAKRGQSQNFVPSPIII